MAEKKIAVAQVIPANYMGVRNRRTNPRGGAGSNRASIGIGGKGASGGGEPTGPASRMTGGMADGVEGPPQVEGQEAIASQGRMPRFAVGNPNAGVINLGSLLSERANEAFDSSKPIGGENVPYKETKGLSGLFRRAFGDQSNERNLEAQQGQAANWRQEDAEIKKQAREDAIEARRDARDEQRFQKRTEVEDRRIAEQAERDRIDKANKWVADNEEYEMRAGSMAADRLLKEKSIKADDDQRAAILEIEREKLNLLKNKTPERKPRFNSLGGGILEDVETGEVFQAREGSPGRGKIPAVQGGLIPLRRSTPPPTAADGGVQVDPATGQPLRMQQGGLTPPKSFGGLEMPQPAEPQATLADRFMGTNLGKAIFDEQKTMTPDRIERLSALEEQRKKENEARIAEMLRSANQSYVDPAFSL
jgi:hypothetical protein